MSTAIQQFRGDNNLLAQAEMLAKANIVPKAFRGKPADVLAAILWGDELGLGPMAAMNFIDIIDGNPTLNTEGRVALVRRAGHSIQITATATQATAVGRRRDTGDEQTVTWTMEMAKRAKLSGKQVWQAYPEAMLTSRAVSQLTRNLFPDVTGGFSYAAEEVASFAAPELMDQPEALVRGVVAGPTSNAGQGTPALATATTPQELPGSTPGAVGAAANGTGGKPGQPTGASEAQAVEVTTQSSNTAGPRKFAPPKRSQSAENSTRIMAELGEKPKSEMRQAQADVAAVNAANTAEPDDLVAVNPSAMTALRASLDRVVDKEVRARLVAKWTEAGLPNVKATQVILSEAEYAVALPLVLDAEEEQSVLDAADAEFTQQAMGGAE